MDTMDQTWIELAAAAEHFGCPVDRVYDLVRQGVVPSRLNDHGVREVLVSPAHPPTADVLAPVSAEPSTWLTRWALAAWMGVASLGVAALSAAALGLAQHAGRPAARLVVRQPAAAAPLAADLGLAGWSVNTDRDLAPFARARADLARSFARSARRGPRPPRASPPQTGSSSNAPAKTGG